MLGFLFPMVSFDDVFWFPMMAAALPASPLLLSWIHELVVTAYGFHLLSLPLLPRLLAFVGVSAALVPAWYLSFLAIYLAGFIGIVLLVAALSGCLWMCEKAGSIARS
jgi:hypothetical protein